MKVTIAFLKPTFVIYPFELQVIDGIRDKSKFWTDCKCWSGHPAPASLADDECWLVTTDWSQATSLLLSPLTTCNVSCPRGFVAISRHHNWAHCSRAGLSGSFHYFTNKFCLFKCLRRARKMFKANPLRAESESWTLPMGAYAEWRALLRPARLLRGEKWK